MSAPLPTASRWNTYSRSRYPRLWDGCVGAWCPSLGHTGNRLHDYSRRMAWATPTAYGATNWAVERGGYGYDIQSGQYLTTNVNGPTGDKSASIWVRVYGTVTTQYTGYSPISWGAVNTLTAGTSLIFDIDPSVNATQTSWTITQIGASNGFTYSIDGLWHHVGFSNTGNTWTMYFDGIQKTSFSLTTATQAGQISFGAIMQTTPSYISKGFVLDDMRVYSRVLNLEEWRLLATRRAIAYEPEYQPAYYTEAGTGGGVAKPVLFHSYYMSQGMRP
jgi:hypothetical protein